jgi:hypothetical protein
VSHKIPKIFIILALIALAGFGFYQTAHPAYAAGLVPCGTSENPKPCSICDLLVMSKNIIDFLLLYVVPSIAVLFYLWAGFLILLSGTNITKIASGQAILRTTTVGLLIFFGSWMITNTVLRTLAGSNLDRTKDWYTVQCINPTGQVATPTTSTSSTSSTSTSSTSTSTTSTLPPGSPLTITTGSLTDAVVDQQYSAKITAGGGDAPYVFSMFNDGPFPDEITVAADGTISGTPTKAGTYTFTAHVDDDSQNSQDKQLSLKVVGGSPLTITNASLADAPTGKSYSVVVAATGGKSPYTWLVSGTLPPGLSFDAEKATISGTPTKEGDYKFTVEADDSSEPTVQIARKEFTLKVTKGSTAGAQCLMNGINLCQGASLRCTGGTCTTGATPSCGASICNQYVAAINDAAGKSGVSANLLKATMFKESACQAGAENTGGNSYGLMQMQPGTANTFADKCGVQSGSITPSWLKDPANANKSICLAAFFLKSLADGGCGYAPRNILAGYSGGPGACMDSRNCSEDTSCSGEDVRRWECLYDDDAHTVCNGDNTVIGSSSKYNETRYSVVNKLYCVDHPGF